MTKPYYYDGTMLQPGDRVGWMDTEGYIHIETFKRWTHDGIEVESERFAHGPNSDRVARAAAAVTQAAHALQDLGIDCGMPERALHGRGSTP